MKAFLLLLLFSPMFANATMVTAVIPRQGETLPAPRADQLEFKIAFDSRFTALKKENDQWVIVVHCSWRNISSEPVSVLLKDHDDYHGTLDYPVGTQVRIKIGDGKVLTANGQYREGWWDFSCLTSQVSALMPGDIVTLKPGEIVFRQFKLDDVLAGLTFTQAAEKAPTLPDGSRDMRTWKSTPFVFPEGDSTIEVKLWNLVATNALTLHVKKEANQSPEPTPMPVTPPAAQEPRRP